jgi:hypothetical protein
MLNLENARSEYSSALIVRDKIDDCCSAEWFSAHQIAEAACKKVKSCLEVCFASKEISKPYWW